MAQVPRESFAALLAQVTAQQRKVEYFTRLAPMLAWQSAWTTQCHTINYVSCFSDLHVRPLAEHKNAPYRALQRAILSQYTLPRSILTVKPWSLF